MACGHIYQTFIRIQDITIIGNVVKFALYRRGYILPSMWCWQLELVIYDGGAAFDCARRAAAWALSALYNLTFNMPNSADARSLTLRRLPSTVSLPLFPSVNPLWCATYCTSTTPICCSGSCRHTKRNNRYMVTHFYFIWVLTSTHLQKFQSRPQPWTRSFWIMCQTQVQASLVKTGAITSTNPLHVRWCTSVPHFPADVDLCKHIYVAVPLAEFGSTVRRKKSLCKL